MTLKKNKIGILGGSFDPAHKGHLIISRIAKKKNKLNYIIWSITQKNPFKKPSKINDFINTEIEHEISKLLEKFSLTDVVEIVHKISYIEKKQIYKKALDIKNEKNK